MHGYIYIFFRVYDFYFFFVFIGLNDISFYIFVWMLMDWTFLRGKFSSSTDGFLARLQGPQSCVGKERIGGNTHTDL